MILKENIVFNEKLLNVFTEDELQDIVDSATVVTEDCIIISTEDSFFELSVGNSNSLDIYCNDNNNIERQLTKDEFMNLYKSSPLMEMQYINVD